MKQIKVNKLFSKGKTLLLACDQGLEHGPSDFNLNNIDPDYIIKIAIKGKYKGLILQKGLAEQYHEHYSKKVPLIVKLNGKMNIPKVEPIARQICSVKKAVDLGADAVGYTIYVGSEYEPEIFKEFGKIQEEAHDYGLPVIAWMYPRGKTVGDELNTDLLAYSARVGLELGADILKMKYNGDKEGFKWIVKCAGKAKVSIAGGHKADDKEFLTHLKDALEAGAVGMAVGRNVWQHNKPLGMTKAIKKIIFENKGVKEALKLI
ncbi:fructose-bisphosphate aldolase [Candidatus Woesearchaeota archaeon]|nr:fructose-bisphosphate aldolase [Candidatus Woesearchaeota archaeon]